MKHTTRNEISEMIDAATAREASQLRRDLTKTLIELATTAKVRREKDIAAAAQLVDAHSDMLKQYVRDMLRTPTQSPNQVPPTAVGSSGSGDYARGYAAAMTALRPVDAPVEQGAYKRGHAAALQRVLDLFRTLPSGMVTDAFVTAVKGMAL